MNSNLHKPRNENTIDLIKYTELRGIIRFKDFFQSRHNEDSTIVKSQTSFISPVNKDRYLEEYIRRLQRDAKWNILISHLKLNISHEE